MNEPTATEMVCAELVTLVTEYLEGTIAEVERARMEEHMGDCSWCERYVEQTRAIVDALGKIGAEPPAPELWERALASFRAVHGNGNA